MKGNAAVIDALQKALSEELMAISQYFLHGEMQSNWGYKRLYAEIKKQAIGEMKHAEALIERIIFLEGLPNLNDFPKLRVGKTVQQQLQNDLALEKEAVGEYNKYIALARKEGDNTSADLFEALLKDEEDHVDFLEAQLDLIEQVGLQNYLSQQLHAG
ncbi:MAG TPA: bacterioferritin [Terriglobia bacterium]|jgi:bacterioferritin|nr:bacterioferritin [Terriglobia bacterium]